MNIPATMRSLVATRKGGPEVYELRELPVPSITLPTHVLLKIHAAGVNTGELQAVRGKLGLFYTPTYPTQLGVEGAGVVVAVGSAVKDLKAGDEVYGAYIDKPMFVNPPPGFLSEYALAEARFLLRKPARLSFEEAAGMATLVTTSYQTWRRGLQLMGADSLEGKTVFIPAGLSGTGAMAAQTARNVFGATNIITTVSTRKMALVERYLPGVYDRVIDYQTQRPRDVVPPGSVDIMYNTQWDSMDDGIPLLNPKTGVLVSISSTPSKATAKRIIGEQRWRWWHAVVLDLSQLVYWWKLRGTSIKYEMVSGSLDIREDLEKAGEIVALGKVKPVMRVVDLWDLEAVRKGCEEVVYGKGGIGKLVVRVV
ncbi:GroES-like protein [Trichoderma reesei RUT C-30]|uniref:GroES-like protein n=1 Tax=Hypocrea jecorina (strain ATCC 56765 / BCRC 32924 / NRRL 11460 / Rut C-30) TaxID=1344414 RepID=A0A024S687_HYPJR|nr:GroES-like protein [Trichoderma reesei RUT C-30]